MANNTLSRLKGYAGLAKDAWRLRRSDEEQVRQIARKHLVERMGKLRGLPQKLGQMMSFSEASGDAADDFAALQEQAEPLPLETVLPLLEAAWGRPADEVLSKIEPDAHAASLGQVHRATTKRGHEVAVKIQYPGIRESVRTDLKMLGWLSMPVGNLKRGFDLAGYREVILEDLEEELDYRQEATHQRAFAAWAEGEDELLVPQVHAELSCETVLVTDWEEGDSWQCVKKTWQPAERKSLANGLVRFFLEGLFRQGIMHADWHPGNLRFRRQGDTAQLLLYDFGCVYRPSDDERLGLLRLIRATRLRSESPWPLFMKLGFSPEFLDPLADKLPALCSVLFEPLAVDYPYEMADWRLEERVSDILGDDRWNFRIAGSPGLVFLLRAFHGLKFYLEGLEAPVMWRRHLEPLLQSAKGQLDQLELPADLASRSDFDSMARHLKIRVKENGRTKVELTQYASGIDDLEETLEPDLLVRIRQQGINLAEIVTRVRQNGYRPAPVFELTETAKHVAVWLE